MNECLPDTILPWQTSRLALRWGTQMRWCLSPLLWHPTRGFCIRRCSWTSRSLWPEVHVLLIIDVSCFVSIHLLYKCSLFELESVRLFYVSWYILLPVGGNKVFLDKRLRLNNSLCLFMYQFSLFGMGWNGNRWKSPNKEPERKPTNSKSWNPNRHSYF